MPQDIEEIVSDQTEPTLADEFEAAKKKMSYETRLNYYACPFEENSVESKIHWIMQRDGNHGKTLFDRLMAKAHKKFLNRGMQPPIVTRLESPKAFQYSVWFEDFTDPISNY